MKSGPRDPTDPPEPDAGRASRRAFLSGTGAAACWALFGGSEIAAASTNAPRPAGAPQDEAPVPPGIDLRTIAEAEKLAALSFTDEERRQILRGIRKQVRGHDWLRAARLDNDEGPAEVFDPRVAGVPLPSERRAPRWRAVEPGPLPSGDEDIAFAPVEHLGRWVRAGRITSERLTRLYVDRLKRYGPQLECVVTLTEDLALEQARRADSEIRRGKHRGPLHGIPWGAKDLFDTRGIATTWGAEPFKDRVAERDAAVVKKLEAEGAVLVAKLTLGALAYGDIWFGGRTRNPWKSEQGSSGSSAGSASATAAGLVAFSLGTETYGSIGSPSARCGATGFRPTFGRVSRAGGMSLAWSLDKVGPICRTVGDCALVLAAIDGADPADPSSVDVPLNIDMTAPIRGVRVGHVPGHYKGPDANDADRRTLEALRSLGARLAPVSLPNGRFGDLISLLINVEAAAAFDELTRGDLDDRLKWQADWAWPNTFRRTRLLPAVEYMQARRLRRRLMNDMAELMRSIDLFVAPQRHGAMHAITNMTGQPALTLRQAFREDGTPRATTLWGRLYDDATLLRVGAALERELGLWARRPELAR